MSESVTCCPLDGGDGSDGDGAKFHDKAVVKAAKVHCCRECKASIDRGTKYELVKAMWHDDVRPSTIRTCLMCVEIRDHFACNGFTYGEVWNNLEENFFPDMKAGGRCMQGLSPAAKRYLIDKRMEWYFAQGEVVDSAWDGWAERRPSV